MLLTIPILVTCLVSSIHAEMYQVAPNIYSWSGTGEYVSMFVVTEDGVMVIEPVNTGHATGLLEAIRSVTDQPVKYLFYSHNHWDHASGGKVFKDAGATVVAHEDAYDWLKANPGPDTFLPDQKWSGSQMDFVLGGVTLELHHFGASHGLGMTAFLVPSAKVIYIADNVTPNRVGFTVLPDFNVKEWERTLGEYLKMDFDKAIYSHSANPEPVKGGDKEDVREFRQYLRDIEQGIQDEIKKGTNPFLVPSTLKLPKYENWAMYDQWLEMNIWAIGMQREQAMGPYLNRIPRSTDDNINAKIGRDRGSSKKSGDFWRKKVYYKLPGDGYAYMEHGK